MLKTCSFKNILPTIAQQSKQLTLKTFILSLFHNGKSHNFLTWMYVNLTGSFLASLRCHYMDRRSVLCLSSWISVLCLSSWFSETASEPVKWGACHIIRKLPTDNLLSPYSFSKRNNTCAKLTELQTANKRSPWVFSKDFSLNYKHEFIIRSLKLCP